MAVMLKVKCQTCGKIIEKPYEFEGFFKEEPDTSKIYDGYCSDECEKIAMDKIALEYPENPDLEVECRTDGSVVGNYAVNECKSCGKILRPVKHHEGGRLNYVELEDGTWLKLVGDGTAFDVYGNKWEQVMEGIGESDEDGDFPEYQSLGWYQK